MSTKSTNVETNVVQMRFDNKNFEKNVKTTMSSLDKLKQNLKFDDAKKSFKTLEENAKKVDFSPLSKGIEKVQASFSFLDTFSATVYHRLSNRLIDLGKKVVSSVSTDGIKSGFSEYELKMNSFKTIKASAGKDFTDSQINEYLEELNRYADKTIYSFSDMTNNIGKFTNAGVKLNVAVKAIQGISNEAAVSGANAEEASRAMYNFSQALSSGYVKLIDWKSIENANMATEEFKNELIKTAASVGTLTKAQNGMYKTQKGKLLNSTRGFNDALQDQWMTTEVLTKTLEKYADETTDIGKKAFDAAQRVNTFSKLIDTLKESIQSGWSRVWELVVGDLERATALWTSISDAVGKFIDKRFGPLIKMLEDWNAHGGRERTLIAIKNVLKSIGELLKPIGRAFREIFPKKTVNDMFAFTESLENFAKKVKPTSEQAKKLQDSFRGIFAAIDILKMAIRAFKKTFGGVFVKILGDVLHTIFGVTGSLGDMLTAVRKNIKENDTFNKVLKPIADTLEKVYEKVKKVIGAIWSFVKIVGNAIKQNGGFNSFYTWISGMGSAIRNLDFKSVLNGIIKAIKKFGKIIDKVLTDTFDFYTPFKEKLIALKTKIQNSKLVSSIVDIFKSMVSGIQKVFNSFRNIKTDGVDEFTDKTKKKFSFFDTLVSFFKKIFNGLISVAKAIWKIAKPVVKFVGKVIKSIFDELLGIIQRSDLGDVGLFMAGGGLGALFSGIGGFFKKLSGFGNTGKSLSKMLTAFGDAARNLASLIKAKTLKEIATSIMILAGALLILALLPQDKLSSSMVIIAALFATLAKAVNSLTSSYKGASMLSSLGITSVILAIASAMMILSASLAVLSIINYENATKALAIMSIVLTMIVASVDRISKVAAKGKTSAITLVSISILIATLASALTLLTVPIIAFSIIIAKQKNGAGNLLKASGILVGVLGAISAIVIVLTKMVSRMRIVDVIKVAGVLYIFGGVFKKLAMSIALLMGTLAIVALLITKNMISIDALETAGSMFVGILAVLSGVIIAFSAISKQFNTGDLVKIASLVAVVSVMVSILSGIFIAISFMSSEKIENGTIGLGAITTALVTILSSFAIIAKLNVFKNIGFADIMKMMLMMSAVLVPFTLAITALLIGMSAFVKTLSKYNIDENIIKTALLMVAGMIGAVAITMTVLADISKNISIKDSLKLSLLVAVITALLLSISLIVVALSALHPERITAGTKGLMIVSASLVLIFTALRIIIGTAEKSKVGLVNGIKSLILITIALNAVVGTLGVLVYLAKLDSFDSALVALLKIGAAITALAYVTGRSKALANGLKALSTTIAALSVAAAAFGVFVAAIVKAFTLLKDLTEEDINRIEKNIKRFGTVFKNTFNDLAKIAGTAIAFVIKTILDTLFTTLTSSGKEILDGLLLLFDSIIAQAPQLIDKAFELLVALLTAIERSLAPVVETALKVAISFINAFANGIRDHSDEILDAISNLIDAVASLIAKSISRVLGLKEWEAGYSALKGIVKNFGALILTIFAINKLRSKAAAATSILSVFITKVKRFASTLKARGFGSAWKEMFGIDKLNASFKTATAQTKNATQTITGDIKAMKGHVLSSMGSLAKGLLTGAGIGIAIGSVAKAFIDAKTEALDATTSWAEDTDSELKKLRDTAEKTADELREARKKNKEDIKEVNKEYDTQESLLERLAKLYDPKTGKVLEGHEDEVKSIAEKINTALGVRLELEGKLLNIIDEQGKKRKVDLDYLKELNDRERLKATLDKNKELIESYKGEGGRLQWQRKIAIAAKKNVDKYESMLKFVEENIKPGEAIWELEKKDEYSKKMIEELRSRYGDKFKYIDDRGRLTKGDLDNIKELENDIRSTISTQRSNLNDAERNIKQMEYEIARYEEGVNAALSGTAEQIHNVNMKYLSGYVAKGTGTTFDMTTALKKQMDMLKNMSLKPGDFDKTQMKQYLEGMLKQMTDLGYNKDTKIEGGYKITLKNQFGADEIKNFDTYGDLYAYYLEAFGSMPELMSEEIANGVEAMGKDSKIKSAVNSFSDSLKEGTTDSFKDGLSANAKGILSNFVSNKDNANGILGFLRADTETHSPSRLYAREFGEPLGEGIIVGMEEAINSYDPSAMAGALISKLQSSIFPAIASLTGNSSLFGGITPVNFGMNQNGSYYSGASNAPATSFASPLPYQPQLDLINTNLGKILEATYVHTDTMVNEMHALREDVGDLASHIDDLEFRLDGDAIVGGLTPKLNNALVRYSNNIGRGQ